jgi:hypothetical protein
MKKIIVICGFLWLINIGMQSCKKCCYDPLNEECENYDPCFKYKDYKSNFYITDYDYETSDQGYDTLYLITTFDSTTMQNYTDGKYIYFRCNHPNPDSVKWKIGIHPNTLIGKNVFLDFMFAPGAIDVMMVVYDNKSKGCNNNDDGIDTIRRKIYIMPSPTLPVYGKYHGFNEDNPLDTFTIAIGYLNYFDEFMNPYLYPAKVVINLPKGKTNGTRINGFWNYRIEEENFVSLPMYTNLPSRDLIALANISGKIGKDRKDIKISYQKCIDIENDGQLCIFSSHVFVGKRIN